jgi:DNA-binding response OmpR family regulator
MTVAVSKPVEIAGPSGKRTILVVDDEPSVRRVLRKCFETECYEVIEAANSEQTLAAISDIHVDLITLDVNLAGEDGLWLAQKIRVFSSIPIIMVSGKGELIDTVVGLEVGADDYITKPFELREVLARVKSALRRSRLNQTSSEQRSTARSAATGVFLFSGCTLSSSTRDLTRSDGERCELTTAEFKLLEALVTHARQVLSRDQIMDTLKGSEWNPNDRTIDNQVARLRKKLDAIGVVRAIKTVRGAGYQFTHNVTRH